jgi:hypothetical protein
MSGPRICPNCGLLVSADMSACQCGYVFGSLAGAATAAGRLRDTVDLFSAKEALSIALQAISELKGGIVRWMVVVAFLQVLPLSIAPKEAVFLAMLLQLWTGLTLQKAALKTLRGEATSLWDARASFAVFGAILLTWMVMLVPIVIGLILFIAPGIYLSLTWSQAPLLILDGRARHVDSLRASEELTRDRRLEILLALAVPLLLMMPVVLMQAAIPLGGSVATPGFALFLVGSIWQMLVATFGTFVSAVVYQMLLNSKKRRG